ncbi:MAG: NYN domain-containing protein [Pirellulales bacterium]
MPLIIDGYNLLHASGIFGRRVGPGGLAQARQALLNCLAAALPPDELPRTTVVFDADRRRGPTRRMVHRGITVLFASQHDDADALIEELIATSDAPRRLVVVSSDHRLHRAARRRRARPVDSDRWFRELLAERRQRSEHTDDASSKPATPLSQPEIDYWTRKFSNGEGPQEDPQKERKVEPQEGHKADRQPPDDDLANPFPPGYGEDIDEEA